MENCKLPDYQQTDILHREESTRHESRETDNSQRLKGWTANQRLKESIRQGQGHTRQATDQLTEKTDTAQNHTKTTDQSETR